MVHSSDFLLVRFIGFLIALITFCWYGYLALVILALICCWYGGAAFWFTWISFLTSPAYQLSASPIFWFLSGPADCSFFFLFLSIILTESVLGLMGFPNACFIWHFYPTLSSCKLCSLLASPQHYDHLFTHIPPSSGTNYYFHQYRPGR